MKLQTLTLLLCVCLFFGMISGWGKWKNRDRGDSVEKKEEGSVGGNDDSHDDDWDDDDDFDDYDDASDDDDDDEDEIGDNNSDSDSTEADRWRKKGKWGKHRKNAWKKNGKRGNHRNKKPKCPKIQIREFLQSNQINRKQIKDFRTCWCTKPKPPTHGRVTTPCDLGYNRHARYSCKKGFALRGPKVSTCQMNRQWSPKPPLCLPDCGPLQDPRHGCVSLTGTFYGSQARYQCDRGYELQGNRERYCQENCQWNGTDATCKIIDCGMPPTIGHGAVIINETTLLSTAKYKCDTGYQLLPKEGSCERTCLDNGEWSGQDPKCVPDCGSLQPINDGTISQSGTTVGHVTVYKCSPGYQLFPKNAYERKCMQSGGWSDIQPECLPECGPLQDPQHGCVALTSNSYGSIAKYKCSSGYELEGNQQRYCMKDGQWNGTDATCKIIKCRDLPNPDFGNVTQSGPFYGHMAVYSCKNGYRLEGTPHRTCQMDGQWSDSAPQCICFNPLDVVFVVDGSGSVNPNFGKELQFVVKFVQSMDIGSGPNQMQVSLIVFSRHVYPRFDLNTYTNKTAMITAVNQTPFPGLSTNTDKALKYVRETSLTQQKGDRAGAHNVVIVMTDGISNNPSATENEANLLKKLPDTTVIAIGIAGADKNEVAKIATDPTNCKLLANFDDLDGFVTELNEMACSPNSDCGSLQTIPDGTIYQSGTTVGHVAVYKCNPGYQLFPKNGNQRNCMRSGTWSDEEPKCLPECGPLQDPQHGCVSLTGNSYGSVAKYKCSSGYELEGNQQRYCMKDGQWNGTDATCKIIECRDLPNPDFGNVTQSGSFYGHMAFYSCKIEYRLEGTPHRTCQMDGQWSDSAPQCLCFNPLDVVFVVDGSGSVYPNFDKELQFVVKFVQSMDIGSGPNQVQVSLIVFGNNVYPRFDLNTYTDKTAMITAINQTPFPNEATSTDKALKYVRETSLTQQKGDRAGAHNVVIVMTDGISNNPPATENEANLLKKLPDTTVFAIGIANANKPEVEKIASDPATCKLLANFDDLDGFVTELKEKTCSANSDCGSLQTIPDGTIYQSGTTVGHVAVYKCNPGYQLFPKNGNQRNCMRSGTWSDEEPKCLPECGPLQDPQHGCVSLTGNSYGSVAKYKCSSGYELEGNQQRYCMKDGQWNGTDATCKIIECRDLPNPDFGNVTQSGPFYGHMAVYSCKNGYRLEGTPHRTCQMDGQWSDSAPQCICFNPLDVVFVVDGSGSVTGPNFDKELQFVVKFVQSMDIGSGPNQVQVGLIVFSSSVYPRFALNTYTDKTVMITAINQTPFPSGVTYTDKALRYVRETSLTQQKGDRAGAQNVVIVMTDGKSTNPPATENEANQLKQLPDTTVIAIGIAKADKNEVAKIASDPTNCKQLANFDDLDGFVTELKEKACSANSGVP